MQNRVSRDIMVRAILIGLLFVPAHSYLITKLEVIFYRAGTSASPIFWTTICNLFFLIAINSVLIRFLPKHRLRQQELLLVYVMTNISTCIIGHDMLQILVPMMGHAFWFASPENEWQEMFWPHIPDWLVVSDKGAPRGYYYGETSFYKIENLLAWLRPVLWWCGFVIIKKMPCAATLHNIFRHIDVKLLELKLGIWAESVLSHSLSQEHEAIADESVSDAAVAIDGKTLRGSLKQEANITHLLSAVSHKNKKSQLF